jgi:hypothetical protein
VPTLPRFPSLAAFERRCIHHVGACSGPSLVKVFGRLRDDPIHARRRQAYEGPLLYDFGCLNEQRRGDSSVQRFGGFEIDYEFEAA